MRHYNGWMIQETPIKYTKPTYTMNDVRGDLRLDGKMTYGITQERWTLLIGDKLRRMEMDRGEQLGRRLFFLDSGAKEEEEFSTWSLPELIHFSHRRKIPCLVLPTIVSQLFPSRYQL
jgi:hypothetical protein